MPVDIKLAILRHSVAIIGLIIGGVVRSQLPFSLSNQIRSAVQRSQAIERQQQAETAETNVQINAAPD